MILCFRVFESLENRVSCLLQYAEHVSNDSKTWFYQMEELCGLLQVGLFLKNVEMTKLKSLYLLVP